MSGVLYRQSFLEVSREQVLLSGGDALALQQRCGNVKILEKSHATNDLYFGGIDDTLKRQAMRYESEETVWKEVDVLDELSFVAYVQIFSAKTSNSSKSTSLVAYSVHVLLPSGRIFISAVVD